MSHFSQDTSHLSLERHLISSKTCLVSLDCTRSTSSSLLTGQISSYLAFTSIQHTSNKLQKIYLYTCDT